MTPYGYSFVVLLCLQVMKIATQKKNLRQDTLKYAVMIIAYDYGGYSYILALRRWGILFTNMRLESWKKIILWHGEIV